MGTRLVMFVSLQLCSVMCHAVWISNFSSERFLRWETVRKRIGGIENKKNKKKNRSNPGNDGPRAFVSPVCAGGEDFQKNATEFLLITKNTTESFFLVLAMLLKRV